jgi:hypothetical protein
VDLNSRLDNDDASVQLQRIQREVIQAELSIKRQRIAFDHEEHTQRLLKSNARIKVLRRPAEVLALSLTATSVNTLETLRELILSPTV